MSFSRWPSIVEMDGFAGTFEISRAERPVPLPEMDVNLCVRAGSDVRESDDL